MFIFANWQLKRRPSVSRRRNNGVPDNAIPIESHSSGLDLHFGLVVDSFHVLLSLSPTDPAGRESPFWQGNTFLIGVGCTYDQIQNRQRQIPVTLAYGDLRHPGPHSYRIHAGRVTNSLQKKLECFCRSLTLRVRGLNR
jgi:hypothetical protein